MIWPTFYEAHRIAGTNFTSSFLPPKMRRWDSASSQKLTLWPFHQLLFYCFFASIFFKPPGLISKEPCRLVFFIYGRNRVMQGRIFNWSARGFVSHFNAPRWRAKQSQTTTLKLQWFFWKISMRVVILLTNLRPKDLLVTVANKEFLCPHLHAEHIYFWHTRKKMCMHCSAVLPLHLRKSGVSPAKCPQQQRQHNFCTCTTSSNFFVFLE